MFWDKKGGSGSLPDLPNDNTPPSMRDYHSHPPYDPNIDEDPEIHSLPVFPHSEENENFNQNIIKSAVENPEEPEDEPELPPRIHSQEGEPENQQDPMVMPRSSKVIELREWNPPGSQEEPFIPKLPMPHSDSREKPIYIKLNKFREARESLEVVKIKLTEIDDLLATIKEVKIKEDKELSNWEREIESIKARIDLVNSEIFDKSM